MILKNNFVFFHNSEEKSSIHDYFKKVKNLEKEYENFHYSDDQENINTIINNLKASNLDHLSESEQKCIFDLLEKQVECMKNNTSDAYTQKIYFFFAVMDFIDRNQLPHPFVYDTEGQIGYFTGEFALELNDIQSVCGYNLLSFSKEKDPKITWDDGWNKLARRLGRLFSCDIENKEYLGLLKDYENFKNTLY